MYTRFTILSLFIAAAFGLANAQAEIFDELVKNGPEGQQLIEFIKDTHIINAGSVEKSDSTNYNSLLIQFYRDQFRHSQDPRAPYFLMLSREGNIAMGVGGDLKLLGYYDWNGVIDGASFSPYEIAIPANDAQQKAFNMSPSRTGLFVSIFGTEKHFGKFQIYVHGKFSGAGGTFKLDRAYATVSDFTFGFAKSTFDDPVAQPSTIDAAGPNSEIDDTRLLLRYMHDVSKKVTVAFSVENPKNQIAQADGQFEPLDNYIPDFAAFIQYGSAWQHLRLSGLVRGLGYRNLVDMSNHHVAGWGVNLSTKVRIANPLTLFAAVNTGQGIGSMVNDLSCGSNDLIGLSSHPGEMYAPRSYGWYGALQYYYTPSVFSTLIFSQERILPKSGSQYTGDDYKYGLYGTANVFWNIAPRLQLGAEVNIGKRVNMDGADRMAYRAAVIADLSF